MPYLTLAVQSTDYNMEASATKYSKNFLVLVAVLGVFKLIFHIVTLSTHGLHRDEYLYFDQGKNLSWGYFEVPPLTPFLGYIANSFGDSTFTIRILPAISGLIIILLACKLTYDLGGKLLAVFITGSSLLLSTSLLGSNSLFQPVSFNQMFWFLLAYITIKIVDNPILKNHCLLGIIVGLGLLTKYSIVFYISGIITGLLLTEQRKKLAHKYVIISIAISFIIFLPNLIWQLQNGVPFFDHMRELSETQLVNISKSDFFISQINEHKGFSIIWIIGLFGLFKYKEFSKYKYLAFAFLITVSLVGFLSGKSYYTLGAFLILFIFGGLTLDKIISSNILKAVIPLFLFILTLPFYPLSTHILNVTNLKEYCNIISKDYGIQSMLRWEDGKYYDLPQDIADMYGWEELAFNVSKIYNGLDQESQKQCMIYAGSYGHMSSLRYFKEKYELPDIVSLNGSYANWMKKDIDFNNQILIDDRKHETSDWFNQMVLVDSIKNSLAREPGYIYYRHDPKFDLKKEWNELLNSIRNE